MSKIKYPILGYAPGSYYCRCSTCGDQFTGDKQAVQCEPCAVNCLALTLEASLSRIVELEREVERLKEEKDLFAMSYCGWYSYAEDAQIYKAQKLPASKMLELYKSRPYLRTDKPENN
jgi:hypothetical protein